MYNTVFVLLSCCLWILTSTTQQHHISQGTAQWEGQTVVSKLIQPAVTTCFTKHYLMCAFQKAADLLFDRCCFKRKVFSFCGIGGLSLLLGFQYNYQRLQAALLPGIAWLSQGYYYFHAELFGSQTQHLNNHVYEAYESKKMNLCSICASYQVIYSGCKQSAVGVDVSAASSDQFNRIICFQAIFWKTVCKVCKYCSSNSSV